MTSERVEYGVELIWPDGSTETNECTAELAGYRIAWHNTPGNSYCTARLVQRTVTVSPWVPVTAVTA